MIIFNWVEWANFLSQGNEPVRMNLSDDHTTLIRGTNGAGKTTVLDAVCYALYNKPLRAVKLGQLVNSVNNKKMLVKINININGVNWEIHRGQKPAIFEIFKDGEAIPQMAAARDTQSFLENDVLGCNFKTFTQVVIIASTGYTNFMELSPVERRVVVEQMLDIEVIGQMSTLIKERKKSVATKASRAENNYNQIRNQIESVKRLIDDVGSNSEQLIADIDKTIGQQLTSLTDLKAKHTDCVANPPDIDMDTARESFATAQEALKLNQGIVRDIGLERASKQLRVGESQTLATYYQNNDSCDRCNQHIDETFKAGTIDGLNRDIATIQSEISVHEEDIKKTYALVEANQAVLNDVNQMAEMMRSWQANCDEIIRQATQVQTRIQQYESQKMGLLSKGQNDTQKYHDEIKTLNEDVEKMIALRAEVTEELELIELAMIMLKDSGLKAKIVTQYLPRINEYINEYLDIMGAQYSFNLDESFNETIMSRYRDNFSYGSFSNGEKMRINLSIIFAWRKLALAKNTVASNLLIMDEILDGSLDKSGIDSIFDIFNSMERSNLLIISHRPEIVDRFDNVITVSKIGNFASYEMGEN